MEEFNSPSPQPEDPGRALNPRLEEDPDISMELVYGTFYQASRDGALVAILADYPGLLPVSNVSKVGALNSGLCRDLSAHVVFLQKRPSGRRASPTGLICKGHLVRAGVRGRRLELRRRGRGMTWTLLCDYLYQIVTVSIASWQEKHPPDCIRISCGPRLKQPDSRSEFTGGG